MLFGHSSIVVETGYGIPSDGNDGYPANNSGKILVPGNNTFGSWVQLVAGGANTADTYMLTLTVHGVMVAGRNRQALVDIGIDRAGGSSYTVVIPEVNVARIERSSPYVSNGLTIPFPLKIPSGASIAIRGYVNDATVGQFYASCMLSGMPERRVRLTYGEKCVVIGSVPSESRGTYVDPGSNTGHTVAGITGTYVALGSAITTDLHSFIMQIGRDGTNTAKIVVSGDLAYGDASNKCLLLEHCKYAMSEGEDSRQWQPGIRREHVAPAGSIIYARLVAGSGSTLVSNMLNVTAHGFMGGQY